MNSNFHAMKPIFLATLNRHLPQILISNKIEDIKENRASFGDLFLDVNIIFPGARSCISAFAPNEKTFRSGIVVGVDCATDEKKYFYLNDYIKYKNIPEASKLVFDTRHVSYTNGFNIALTCLVDIYNGPLRDILLGKTWEDIPFDWGDYK